MTGERVTRRLAAILAADVVGYSRLMGRDEQGTLTRLKAHRTERLEPTLTRHGGRLVKLTGDGALVEFPSAVDALSAAIEFQQAMAEANRDLPTDTAIVFRIGLHLGDLIVEGDDLYGDGVNVAARLEAEAPPGGIVISRTVHEAVTARLKASFDDLGNLSLKNIERPVQAFGVKWDPLDWKVAATTTAAPSIATPSPADAPLALPDKPSIAVLPFQNMSGDPEQEYFADGMVEDIVTALSRFKSLFVIARNSSFTYKGKAVDIKQVGRELGVRYVLEGSVRKAGGKVRITGQLIDSQTSAQLWADRFDGALEDIFDLQDRVTSSVVGAVVPKLDLVEIERAKRKPVENLDAYDLFLRGVGKTNENRAEAREEAYRLFRQAIELDPGFAPSYALAARYFSFRKTTGRVADKTGEEAEVRELAARVAAIGHDDAFALAWAGHSLMFVCREVERGGAMVDQALVTNPNLAVCWQLKGSVSMYRGNHELAIEELTRALRMSPVGPDSYHIEQTMSAALLHLGKYAQAQEWCTRVLARIPNATLAMQGAAVAHAQSGSLELARQMGADILRLRPEFTISSQKEFHPFLRREDAERWLEGLRLAGVPE
ncbi:MAG: adenylate/guanylate cyclase domain-containing protein [Enhydrobacter sp.]